MMNMNPSAPLLRVTWKSKLEVKLLISFTLVVQAAPAEPLIASTSRSLPSTKLGGGVLGSPPSTSTRSGVLAGNGLKIIGPGVPDGTAAIVIVPTTVAAPAGPVLATVKVVGVGMLVTVNVPLNVVGVAPEILITAPTCRP